MGSEGAEEGTPPKLPLLFSIPPTKSPKQYSGMGMITPPHHTASVPFIWEEEPGKPRPSKAHSLPATDNATFKGLDLPPRLLKLTKTSSPTPILEGPYVGRSIFHSSRFITCREVSFDGGRSAERSLVLSKRWLMQGEEKGGASSGSWRKTGLGLRQGKEEVVDEGGFVFCGVSGDRVGVGGDTTSGSTRKRRSLLGLTKARSSFWESIYEAVKQLIPGTRRSKNGKWEH